MFDISGNSKGESGESGTQSKDAVKKTESIDQRMVYCPSILTGMSRELRTHMNAIVAFSFLLNKKEYCDDERRNSYDILLLPANK